MYVQVASDTNVLIALDQPMKIQNFCQHVSLQEVKNNHRHTKLDVKLDKSIVRCWWSISYLTLDFRCNCECGNNIETIVHFF